MWRWDPDTFGSLAPNTNPAGLGSFSYNLRFPGQYSLNESGLYYNYFRDYDPQTGRYIESDPFGLAGGLSIYGYALANPLQFNDPFGLEPPEPPGPPSIGLRLDSAIKRGDVKAIEDLLEVLDSPEQEAPARNAIQRLNSTAEQIISKECRGSVNRRFPSEWKKSTLKQIMDAAKSGNDSAQTAFKLPNDLRFKK